MKLLEILARELKEWPEGVMTYSQDDNGTIGACDSQPSRTSDGVGWSMGSGNWVQDAPHNGFKLKIASDASTAIVTRADLEAQRAKLSQKKANADGWVRHRGGKCPVEAEVQVECKLRNGNSIVGRASCIEWSHTGAKLNGEVMRYRIHKPAEQTCLVEARAAERLATLDPAKAVSLEEMEQRFAGPLEWRDRIRELDTQRAEVEATYQRQISEITQERESLVQKLAGEGLALAEVVVQPAEDMSDPANWKVGDVFVQVCGGSWNHQDGTLWTMLSNDGTDMKKYASDSGSTKFVKDHALKFHSRPAT